MTGLRIYLISSLLSTRTYLLWPAAKYYILSNTGRRQSYSPRYTSHFYRFYGGNLIFRGHFTATGEETAVNLSVQYGFAGGYTAWLNGVFLGSSQGNSTVSLSSNTWTIPDNTLKVGGDNVLVVLQGG